MFKFNPLLYGPYAPSPPLPIPPSPPPPPFPSTPFHLLFPLPLPLPLPHPHLSLKRVHFQDRITWREAKQTQHNTVSSLDGQMII